MVDSPKDTIRGMFWTICAVLIIFLGTSAVIIEGRNDALRRDIEWKDAKIFDLTMEIVALKTTENDCKLLQYHLPEICLNELSRVAFKIKQVKAEIEENKRRAK